jgi:putative endonuclease
VHHVYIVQCADGTLYTGYAIDPEARVAAHNAGRGARYTRSRRPVTLVYAETCASKSQALAREFELKRLPRATKQALIFRSPYATPPHAVRTMKTCSAGRSSSSKSAPAAAR